MTTDGVLSAGVERGIITAEQAAQLRMLETQTSVTVASEVAPTPDDESLRFIGGFGDVFVVLGIVMFVGAIAYFTFGLGAHVMWAIMAVIVWLLAEFFARKRYMAFPSIVLMVLFALSVCFTSGLLMNALRLANPSDLFTLGIDQPTMLLGAAAITIALTALHYWRFRVPITVAAGCAVLIFSAIRLVYALNLSEISVRSITLACGVAVFALAMRFDLSDPERVTRRTDIAFWLHLLASPLIVHSLVGGLVQTTSLNSTTAAVIIAIFLCLGFVAVLIDRRAMLVSGLVYAGYAFATLIREAGVSNMTTPITILALGAFVLLLSAGWQPLRRAIIGLAPAAVTRRLPRTATIRPA